jgi:hypothetical protein
MRYFNRRAERERKERDTPERILALAKQKGRFCVSLRYRDDWLRKRCHNLKKQGLLSGGKREGGELVYFPVLETSQ